MNHGKRIKRRYYWHSTFGTGCITASGLILQPNVQEKDFLRAAPYLESLNPATVYYWFRDLQRAAHDNGIWVPAYEEFCPERSFMNILCGDNPSADLPPFCSSSTPKWGLILHNHLKRDKVVPSSHPQHSEIKWNSNGYIALAMLLSRYHPAYFDNGILLKPHPTQGKQTLDEHFRRAEFYYYAQFAFLHTEHDWLKDIHVTKFIDSCSQAAVLRVMYNQEKHVPAMAYKFTRDRITTTLKEYIESPSFEVLGGRRPTSAITSHQGATQTATTTRYRFARGSSNNQSSAQRTGIVPLLVLVINRCEQLKRHRVWIRLWICWTTSKKPMKFMQCHRVV